MLSNLYTYITLPIILQNSVSFSMSKRVSNIISCVDPLGFPFKTLDPFLFCVYHKDNYPAGDSKMQAPRKGNGI